MKIYMTVMLRSLLYISLAIMAYDIVRVEQKFELLDRGYIDNFSVTINNQMGKIFLAVTIVLVVLNVLQLLAAKRNKRAKAEDYILPEYDPSDERSVEITGKAVRFAFAAILVYTFLILGSYMSIPTYFLDYVWFPIFTTASIPIVGLLTYLLSFNILYSR